MKIKDCTVIKTSYKNYQIKNKLKALNLCVSKHIRIDFKISIKLIIDFLEIGHEHNFKV